jgi:hypothetical protein
MNGDVLHLWVTSPPVDGAANKAVTRYLSSRIRVPDSQIVIVSGEASRTKRIRIPLPLDELMQRLTTSKET